METHRPPRDRSLRPLVVALIPGQQRSLEKLKRMRQEVSNELVETINEFGPKMFEDFDEVRLYHIGICAIIECSL